ncbi:MAG TPA: HD domain-containing protein [Candidatus Nitrosotalea sp.]|nr:HD domain-containing protein [Candidatus Nitrosotalea sp.]
MLSEFFHVVSELKKTQRKGWKEKVGIEKPESVADHSYGVAVMAMVFSDIESLDASKTMRMALLHDLAESITGDFMPGEVSKESKREVEAQAMKELLSKLPPNLEQSYTKIWQEYLDGKSREAALLHEIDKLEMALQASKYFGEGFSMEKLGEFIESARKEIKSKDLLSVLDSL